MRARPSGPPPTGMVFVKAPENSGNNSIPKAQMAAMMEDMGRVNDELVKAGIMKPGDCDGLTSCSYGKRVAFDG